MKSLYVQEKRKTIVSLLAKLPIAFFTFGAIWDIRLLASEMSVSLSIGKNMNHLF